MRAFKSVGGTPVFMEKARGSYLYDADGNKYIDYISSWGPMILGHAHKPVIKAIQKYAAYSTSFGINYTFGSINNSIVNPRFSGVN